MGLFVRFGVAGLVAALMAMPSIALADYFTYVTDSGTLAYTDELKRVPARYRGTAKRHQERSFWNYRRLTPVPKGASFAPSEGVYGVYGEAETDQASASAPTANSSNVNIRADRDLQIAVPEGEGPVKVTRRTVWERGASRRQVVVSRGDETVAVIDRPDLYLSE